MTEPDARRAREPVDWESLHRRLAESRERLDARAALSPSRKREILAERARVAALLPAPEERGALLEVVEFTLGGERFAVEGRFVREVAPLGHLAFVPWAPAFLAGIVNLRGRIVSVVDLGRVFGLQGKAPSNASRVIVIGDGPREMGLFAQAALGVRRIRQDELKPPPPTIGGLHAALCTAVTVDLAALLDASALLSDERLAVGGKERAI